VARWWILLLLVVAGCGGSEEEPAVEAPPSIELTSRAFAAGAAIPRRYTCDGDDTSPPLAWRNVPADAQSLALLMDDAGGYTHWTVYAIPPGTLRAQEGKVPPQALEGENSFGDAGYGGPCPPKGDEAHRYVFALYALRADPGLELKAKPDDVREAIEQNAIARGRLVGTFKRG
jgi:Raf kinase inhibitor-like YbhB/YbcL family protein